MGHKQSKPSELTQSYHGAKGPLQYTLGVDKVLDHWIRSCGWRLNEIPKDIFRFVLKYTSFFDDFQFQEHYLWKLKKFDDPIRAPNGIQLVTPSGVRVPRWCSATKSTGGGIHHNALFGSVLTGDIEYRCTVQMSISKYSENGKREMLSVGLVEPDFYEYTGQHMHSGKKGRCVFMHNRYYDCNGQQREYDPAFQYRRSDFNMINLVITVNMKRRTFSITDTNGCSVQIDHIPDERVICFEVWPTREVKVTNQIVKWV